MSVGVIIAPCMPRFATRDQSHYIDIKRAEGALKLSVEDSKY